jgi:hypothetical protein
MTDFREPIATYRIQFSRDFTFEACRELVPYLHDLGITDLYAFSRLNGPLIKTIFRIYDLDFTRIDINYTMLGLRQPIYRNGHKPTKNLLRRLDFIFDRSLRRLDLERS